MVMRYSREVREEVLGKIRSGGQQVSDVGNPYDREILPGRQV